MDHRPLVSVIIPTWNRAALLREAVESVRAQTYDRWELIVVDDGSTDETATDLAARPDPRIRLVREPHCGNAAALRNRGVRASRGELVAFLDSDDVWRPEKLDAQVRETQAHAECGWSYTGLVHIDGEGREMGGPDRPPYRGWILEDLLETRAAAQTSTVMVRRSLFDAVGGFDESLLRCQDYDLWLRLAEKSEATVVATPLTGFRQHAGNRRVGWLDVLGYMERIYAGASARATSPAVRRLCRRQRVRVSLDIAEKSRAAGRSSDAVRAVLRSFALGWSSPRWWSALLKSLVHPLVPGFLLAKYHRRRSP